MKNKSLSVVTRVILIVLVFSLLILLGAFLASRFRFQVSSPIAPPIVEVDSFGSELGQIEFVSGQQMSSEQFNLNANLSVPTALSLPLKTLSDFPQVANLPITAKLVTNRGTLVIELFPDLAPVTVANFVALGQQGFYNQLKFHRVESGFVAQVGDPESSKAASISELANLGAGFPGYRIVDEFSPQLSHDQAGILSMANLNLDGRYPNSGGSQFFITLAPATYLDGRHAIFGRVTSGLDLLPKLVVGDQILRLEFE